jgi:predicted Zn finger-like uncharacterized protein
MQITCPTCGARYEVADGLIAAGGRHVQCSACHARWFERPPAVRPERLREDEILARLEVRGRGPRLVGRGEGGADRSGTGAAPPAERGGRDFVWEAKAGTGSGRTGSEARGHLRLVAAGEDGQAAGGVADRATVAVAPAPEPVPAPPSGSPSAADGAPAAEAGPPRRTGWAFSLLLLVVALLAAVYLLAEPIADAVPGIGPALDAFTAAVDALGTTLGRLAGAVGDALG